MLETCPNVRGPTVPNCYHTVHSWQVPPVQFRAERGNTPNPMATNSFVSREPTAVLLGASWPAHGASWPADAFKLGRPNHTGTKRESDANGTKTDNRDHTANHVGTQAGTHFRE